MDIIIAILCLISVTCSIRGVFIKQNSLGRNQKNGCNHKSL